MIGISNRCAMTSFQCVGILQNNHENNSVEQKHSKREHYILFRTKMTNNTIHKAAGSLVTGHS